MVETSADRQPFKPGPSYMRVVLPLVIWGLLCGAGGGVFASGELEIQARRQQLEDLLREKITPLLAAAPHQAAYQRKLDLLRQPHAGGLFCLPGERFLEADENDASLQQLSGFFAEAVVKQAREALQADEPALAYQLLHEAAFFEASEQTASRLIAAANASERSMPSAALAQTKHPRLNWPARSYWRVTTDHYQIVTDHGEQAGIEIAQRLEQLYAVWSQLFFDCWSSKANLEAAWNKARPLTRSSRTRHRVVLFSSRGEYVKFLESQQPRIAITLGFYDLETRTSFFFAGPDASTSTQIHEATHQLFQELQNSSPRLAEDANFWVIEGIALYMESLLRRGPYAVVGGIHANRLQFARYRRLQEGFYLPAAELVLLGRVQLQADENIRKLYSQFAGFTHFLMDGHARKYRTGLIQYLRSVYQGRDRQGTLFRCMGTDARELDRQYGEFLDVSDADLASSGIQPNEITALCLGRTSITDEALRSLPPQRDLDWLDLSYTPATDAGLRFAGASTVLRQVSLERTRITDRALSMLARCGSIDELDLSYTPVSDDAVQEIAKLPNLRRLWLTGTRITDRALDLLAGVDSLQELDLAETQVTAEGKAKLARVRPDLVVE